MNAMNSTTNRNQMMRRECDNEEVFDEIEEQCGKDSMNVV